MSVIGGCGANFFARKNLPPHTHHLCGRVVEHLLLPSGRAHWCVARFYSIREDDILTVLARTSGFDVRWVWTGTCAVGYLGAYSDQVDPVKGHSVAEQICRFRARSCPVYAPLTAPSLFGLDVVVVLDAVCCWMNCCCRRCWCWSKSAFKCSS